MVGSVLAMAVGSEAVELPGSALAMARRALVTVAGLVLAMAVEEQDCLYLKQEMVVLVVEALDPVMVVAVAVAVAAVAVAAVAAVAVVAVAAVVLHHSGRCQSRARREMVGRGPPSSAEPPKMTQRPGSTWLWCPTMSRWTLSR